ncbi:hypothetical protein A1O3_09978 [Capronia epimyces CBS 606.96]|uniref:Histone chaperone RTT106/FACT complex subunit SPT16-like middle domain-containing protein n=1 Tax=Capronia epimyces CBS 606.96 TaxID=1182542 RepID=W9Y5M0_9EURO|nr:uncharacterized protein A1O3_09978 [Capronia epimyces CBS 606.96]EXJ77749.1 hypothetical protein A1O3_09978 [Capronia epimyces CBS 606.96]
MLFQDIARYHLYSHSPYKTQDVYDELPAPKKRKLATGSRPINSAPQNQNQNRKQNKPRQVILEVRDVSFTLPQRKKLHLGIAQYGADIHSQDTHFAIFTRNPATSEVDMEVPLDQFAHALRLPVPEKAAKQYNFCLLPKPESSVEPIIWAVNHGPLKSCHISSPELAKLAPSPDEVLEAALDFVLNKSSGVGLTFPTAEEFASAKPESHRQADKAYHVKAFRGSKDGYLFFLQTGIFFGFKKPLAFFAFEHVESISYTSVLQRTFNLNIAYRQPPPGGDSGSENIDSAAIQEVEFSMLDQADFPGIDAYVRRHGLQDASLAESRRATKKANAANANGKLSAREDAAGGSGQLDDEEEDTRTELEKAQQQLEDEEDEEEEDYDPGSEGESDGSGSSESEADDEQDGRGRKMAKPRNLVADELGSEAEDVSLSEDEAEAEDPADEEDVGDAAEDGDEGDPYDDDVDEHPAPSTEDNAASSHGHQPGWRFEAGMPDPEDEDQL